MAILIDRAGVRVLVDQGAQLIEVLPAREYAEDHLPGATNHPLSHLAEEADRIDRNRPLVVYCWDAA